MATRSMKDALEGNVKEIRVNQNGTPLVSYEEQRTLGQKGVNEHWDSTRQRDNADIGIRKMNPDGTVAKSWYTSAAINFDRYYDNRYRVVNGVLEIITATTPDGYRAIQEQKSGRVFAKLLPALTFAREGSELVYKKTVMVSDTEFISEFTHKLNNESMKEVLKKIPSGGEDIPEGNLPI